MARAPIVALAVCAVVVAVLPTVHSQRIMDARLKCSACRAVAEVLSQRLEEEVPRNHLDLRHRLDEEGKRWGKVIDYKMSELRVIHLLEGLCSGMVKYEMVAEDETHPAHWARTEDLGQGRRNPNRHLVKEQRKELENYCHDTLERHEDSLSQALRAGQVTEESTSDYLCVLTARHCDEPLAQRHPGDGAEAAAPAAAAAAAAAQRDAETQAEL